MVTRTLSVVGALACALATMPARDADAFCGFYVSGADTKLYNNATMVVMMREGTRTVLSMQNNYQGPPQDFAMVVPVPVILQKENVKTLPREVFDRVDSLAAPRLVEYWEQDPCNPHQYMDRYDMVMKSSAAPEGESEGGSDDDYGVKIEARFSVGEYNILILSANDASGLDGWLRKEKYTIPDGAEPILRPYVQSGMKFFVAKVDVKKVAFKDGMAMLSPLRFHYDSEQFNLPVRLGLVNSAGAQDLIVHILARGQRFEVANYPNVTIPTNIDVKDVVRTRFGAFYASLFDETVSKNKGAVVTEYSWDSGSCDPCPVPPLSGEDTATLGADVSGIDPSVYQYGGGFVLTRLHARYGKDTLGEDLVFRTAEPIVGGREHVVSDGKIERGAQSSGMNNFQARYVIRHEWTGAIACEKPQRGVWGGPPGGGDPPTAPAKDTAFAPRDGNLATFVAQDIEEIDFKRSEADPDTEFKTSGIQQPKSGGCAGCQATRPVGGAFAGAAILLGAALAFVVRRKQR